MKIRNKMKRKSLKSLTGHSQTDIVPKILDYMGYSTKEPLQGKSLVPALNGGNVKDNYVFFRI